MERTNPSDTTLPSKEEQFAIINNKEIIDNIILAESSCSTPNVSAIKIVEPCMAVTDKKKDRAISRLQSQDPMVSTVEDMASFRKRFERKNSGKSLTTSSTSSITYVPLEEEYDDNESPFQVTWTSSSSHHEFKLKERRWQDIHPDDIDRFDLDDLDDEEDSFHTEVFPYIDFDQLSDDFAEGISSSSSLDSDEEKHETITVPMPTKYVTKPKAKKKGEGSSMSSSLLSSSLHRHSRSKRAQPEATAFTVAELKRASSLNLKSASDHSTAAYVGGGRRRPTQNILNRCHRRLESKQRAMSNRSLSSPCQHENQGIGSPRQVHKKEDLSHQPKEVFTSTNMRRNQTFAMRRSSSESCLRTTQRSRQRQNGHEARGKESTSFKKR